MTQAPRQRERWWRQDDLPSPLVTTRFVLEPLSESHAALDFTALMSCRERLRRELQWGDWPLPDFTLEANRDDLQAHHDEFVNGLAFAYTVLDPTRTQCLGCVYLERCPEVDGAQLAFWVIDAALGMEPALVADVLEWVHSAWPIDRVVLPLRLENGRGLALAKESGFEEVALDGPLAAHRCFLSERTAGRDDG